MGTIMRQMQRFVTRFNEPTKWNRLSLVPNSARAVHNAVDKTERNSILYRQLYAKIMSCGPITVADYMKEVLTHPVAGYYMTKDMFGRKGDFITSPEISQLFGEMIAVWIVYEWSKISKDPFQLVELGPGKGTLMSDIIRVFRTLKVSDKVSIHLVEVSPFLSSIQAEKLCVKTEDVTSESNVRKSAYNPITYYKKGVTEDNIKVFWYRSIKDVPEKFSVFVAHEFFDALPVHIFQRVNQEWKEVLIDISRDSQEQKFCYVLSPSRTPACLYIPKDEKRDHLELSVQTMLITEYMSKFLHENNGFALIADYGHCGDKTDTFRAFKEHKLHDPLLEPGSADLTVDVDFSMIKAVAEKDKRTITFGPLNQGNFLLNLGISVRLEHLLNNATDEQKPHVQAGYDMIVNPDKMGERFKMLAMFPFALKKHFDECPIAGF